jgi:hypothetical protein
MLEALHIPSGKIIRAGEAYTYHHQGLAEFERADVYQCPICRVPLVCRNLKKPRKDMLQAPSFSARHAGTGNHGIECIRRLKEKESFSISYPTLQVTKKIIFTIEKPVSKPNNFPSSKNVFFNNQEQSSNTQNLRSSPYANHCLIDLLSKSNRELDDERLKTNTWVRDKKGKEIPIKEFLSPPYELNYQHGSGLIYGTAEVWHDPPKKAVNFKFKRTGNMAQPIYARYTYDEAEEKTETLQGIIADLRTTKTVDVAFIWKGYKKLNKVLWLTCVRDEVFIKF